MDIDTIVGLAFMGMGVVEMTVAHFVFPRTFPENESKPMVLKVIWVSGAGMALVGSMLLAGWIAIPKG